MDEEEHNNEIRSLFYQANEPLTKLSYILYNLKAEQFTFILPCGNFEWVPDKFEEDADDTPDIEND